MKPIRVALAVLALGIPASAHAALIGLAGTDYDPPPITSIGFQDLNSCNVGEVQLPSDYSCAFYDFANLNDIEGSDPVNSIDFRLLDSLGQYVPFEALTLDRINSDLQGALVLSTLFTDGVTFTLSGKGEQSIFPCYGCVLPALVFFAGPDVDGDPHDAADVAGFSVSVVGVNGQANPGATRVPEPATLLLMGPAALLLARRRKRSSKAA